MQNVKNIKPSEFETEVLLESKPVVVKFWAPWCGPCKVVGPILDELATEYCKDVKFVSINADDGDKEVLIKYGIRGIPTILFFKEGSVESILTGNQTKSEIEKKIKSLL